MFLAGCSQTTRINSCTATQKNILIKETNQLNYQIIQKRQALIQVQQSLHIHNCRSPFLTADHFSKICKNSLAKAQTIEAEISALHHQSSIYQTVIHGAVIEHPSLSPNGCAILSNPTSKLKTKRQREKITLKSQQTKSKRQTQAVSAAQSKAPPEKLMRHPLEDAEYQVYTPPASVKITHEITPESLNKKQETEIQKTDFAPAAQNPKAVATGAERPYQPNPKIRVIGSGFFPGQAAVTALPVQDPNP